MIVKNGSPLSGTSLGVLTRSRFYWLFAAIMCAMGALAPSAVAVQSHPLLFTFKLQGFSQDIAASEGNHHIYVPNFVQGVYNFDQSGIPDPITPKLVSSKPLEPVGVAVDNGGGPSNGMIYARGTTTVGGESYVQQFGADGIATAVQITDGSIPADGTSQIGRPPVEHKNEANFGTLFVAGETLFVQDRSNHTVDEFSPSGEFIVQSKIEELGNINGLVITPSGDMYFGTSSGLSRRDEEGNCIGSCDPIVSGELVDLALAANGNLVAPVRTSTGDAIREYDLDGNLLTVSGVEEIHAAAAIATDRTLDRIYIVEGGFEAPQVSVFGPIFIRPDAETTDATGVTDEAAVLHGVVGADGGPDATCAFEYVDDANFKSTNFEAASNAACGPGGPFSGTGSFAVTAEPSDLRGGTLYHYRLVGTSSNGSTFGETKEFTTHGPSVSNQSASAIGTADATLQGSIDPRGNETTYRFQYVTQAQFDASEFDEAIEVPVGGAQLAAVQEAVPVSSLIAGLSPGTTYHFRLLATSSDGTTRGLDTTFATYPVPTEALPDGRAYEQATPVEKFGSSAQGETNAVQASLDGNRVSFFSNAGFPGGEGAQAFPSYLASRNSAGTGWSTQGLLPPASTGPFALVLGWDEALRHTYASNKQVGSPPVLYQRSSSDRSLQTIASGEAPLRGPYSVAVTADDGDAVLFEMRNGEALTPGAVDGKTNAYLWTKGGGTVLAGVLNDGQAPSGGTFAGSYDWFHGRTESGGASAEYFLEAGHALSIDGERLFFTAAESGRLYMRENPAEAQSPLDGEGDCVNPALACTIEIARPEESLPDPGQPAAFIGATADGSTVFFMSSGKLTQDANVGGGESNELYRYETETGEITDLSADAGDVNGAEVQGVLGYSEDGSSVYFAANGVLAPGAKPGNCKVGDDAGACSIYLSRGSSITFIARVSPGVHTGQGSTNDVLNWSPGASLPASGSGVSSGRVSADGLTLLFKSVRRLTPYDNQGKTELYLYRDGADPAILCVSCNPTGVPPTGNAALQAFPDKLTGPKVPFGVRTRNLSADGSRVFFESPDALVLSDVNGVRDVYEWEASGSGSCESESQNGGCLYLLSGGKSSSPSYFGDADASGANVFIFTAERLVGQDLDELTDVYDVRVGGGIAAQNPPPKPPPCEGEGCRSAPPPAGASIPSPGSASFAGPPNPRPHHRKAKPKKKKHQQKKHKQRKHQKKGGRR